MRERCASRLCLRRPARESSTGGSRGPGAGGVVIAEARAHPGGDEPIERAPAGGTSFSPSVTGPAPREDEGDRGRQGASDERRHDRSHRLQFINRSEVGWHPSHENAGVDEAATDDNERGAPPEPGLLTDQEMLVRQAGRGPLVGEVDLGGTRPSRCWSVPPVYISLPSTSTPLAYMRHVSSPPSVVLGGLGRRPPPAPPPLALPALPYDSAQPDGHSIQVT
jgi:hypothetical protein